GNGLPRVAHDETRAADALHAPAGQRRDATEGLEDVQREPFAGEQHARLALERRQDGARLGERSLPRPDGDANGAERAKAAVEERQPRDDEPLLGVKYAARARAGRHERFT